VIARKRSKEEVVAELLRRKPTEEQRAAMELARARARPFMPTDRSLADELIAERHREALVD